MGKKLANVLQRLTTAVVALFVAATLIGLPLIANQHVHAQTNSSQGLQVSPVIVDLNGEKGGNYTLKLTVTNVTPNVLNVTTSVNDFTAADDSGNPKIIDNNTPAGTYSLRAWISPIDGFTLQPKQSQSITVPVHIPSNAESGGHYGVIRFSGQLPDKQGNQVSLNASVGTLLLARVAGNVTEKLVVKDMYGQKGKQRAGVVPNGPIDIVTEVSNTGNVHVKPIGTLTVKDTFGKVVASYPFGSATKNVLPGSTRRYDQTFDKRFLFGRYTANVQAAYGTTGGVLLGSTSFWVIPYQLIVLILIVIAVVVLLTRRLLRRYKHHVIRQAQSQHKHHKQDE